MKKQLSSPAKVAGVVCSNALMNGAYIHSKSLEDIEVLVKSSCGAIVAGSISIKPRKPNPGRGYWLHKERFFSLNSFGMPNGGFLYFKTRLPKMVKLAHKAGKPLIANLIGFSVDEWPILVQFAEKSGVDLVELNFGCPNVWEEGRQERIVSYHASLVTAVLQAVADVNPKVKVGVKISPLPPDILKEVTDALVASKIVSFVTATNSYPNSAITYGAQVNGPDDTLAGLAGRALKPISLGVVKQLHTMLPKHIDIIGSGGIASANDVKDFLAAGAKAVQLATALKEEGPAIFQKILYQAQAT